MKPKIENLGKIKVIGMREQTCLAEFNPSRIWKKFMPRKRELKNLVDTKHYSIQSYSGGLDLETFTDEVEFERWAAVQVRNFDDIPKGMESLTLKGGKYAVFIHKGPASKFQATMQNIMGWWLPNSKYELDDREHFEVLGAKYLGPTNPASEEEVWVPIRDKMKG